ncbi:MAG TPA: response regulator transcription factor [Clostridiales bacterium]|nr:response regulator transcription factor [Clostridiales bacterium]
MLTLRDAACALACAMMTQEVNALKGKILVAEDDPAILKLLETNLQVAGYQVVCATDGQQAL